MTAGLLFVGFILGALVSLGLALLCLGRPRDTPVNLAPLKNGAPPERAYRPIARLFDEQDWRFLSRQKGFLPGMKGRLHRGRRLALSFYLRQIRGDFNKVWAVCRALARTSRDPEFGVLVAQQFLVFHALYLVLQFRCVFGFVPLPVNGFELVGALGRLHEGAQRAMQSLDQKRGAPALSRT